MVISLKTTSGGASSIGYGLTKKRDIQQADNILNKQNENVIFPDFGGFNISEGVTHLKPR